MRRLVAAVAAAVIALTGTLVGQPTAAEAHSTIRIQGSDRYSTSVEVSKWSSWSGDTVFLASGTSFPDALAAAPVAAAERAHFMLTDPTNVPASVMAELQRLRPSEVVLVGGTGTISDNVLWQVYAALGTQVTRIGGTDRVHTSMLLLDRLRETRAVSEVWVVSGWSFPDALVAGSVAGRNGAGILLDYHGSSDAESAAWVDRVQPYFQGLGVNIAGGGSSVSSWVEQRIRYSGAAGVWRYSGSNRYETAVAIHNQFSQWAAQETMVLASGENFPDALSGASYAAVQGFPLFLAPSQCNDTVAAMLRNERDRRYVNTIIGLGGGNSLSDRALNLENCPPPPPPPVVTPPTNPGPSIPPPPHPASPYVDVDCVDFGSRAAAQAWWDYWHYYGGISNPGRLDGRDNDGLVCESWP